MNLAKEHATAVAAAITLVHPINTKESTVPNTTWLDKEVQAIAKAKADLATRLRLEAIAGISGELLALTVIGKKAFDRMKEYSIGDKRGYTVGDSSAPKGVGMNDAGWTCDFNMPYDTLHAGGVEVPHAPIHGWPTKPGMHFDDNEDLKTQQIAESRGYTLTIEPKDHGETGREFTSWSPQQGAALSSLLQVCSARGISPSVFTEQQINKYVRDFMAKKPAEVKEVANLTRFL
jgi:hypothetical protein